MLLSTDGIVYDINIDPFITGNILFIDQSCIKSTDGSNTIIIAGASDIDGFQNGDRKTARFNKPQGFVLLNSTTVVILDTNNHCLRLLNRLSSRVTTIAGACTTSGYLNGIGTQAKFNFPIGGMMDKLSSQELLYVTDYYNSVLRVIELTTYNVRELYKFDSVEIRPVRMMMHNNDRHLFIVLTQNRPLQVSLMDSQDTTTADQKNFDVDVDEILHQDLQYITHLYDDIYMIADLDTDRVLFWNLETNFIESYCVEINQIPSDTAIICASPKSFLLMKDKLYVGLQNRIIIIPGRCAIMFCVAISSHLIPNNE